MEPRLLWPQLSMELDGTPALDETTRMISVANRLALWVEYIDGRIATASTRVQRKQLAARRRKVLAAIAAMSKLTW